MDPFALYLAVINAVTFLLFTIDYWYCVKTGRDQLIDHTVLALFGLAGGCVGMLAAFLLWDRKVVKDNVAWRFEAILLVILWGIVVACVYGFIDIDVSRILTPVNRPLYICLGAYLLVMNLATFILFGVDKHRAIRRRYRIPEFVLLMPSLLGGALGGMLGMYAFRHKVRRWYFRFGLPVFLVLHVALFVFLRLAGVL